MEFTTAIWLCVALLFSMTTVFECTEFFIREVHKEKAERMGYYSTVFILFMLTSVFWALFIYLSS